MLLERRGPWQYSLLMCISACASISCCRVRCGHAAGRARAGTKTDRVNNVRSESLLVYILLFACPTGLDPTSSRPQSFPHSADPHALARGGFIFVRVCGPAGPFLLAGPGRLQCVAIFATRNLVTGHWKCKIILYYLAVDF